MQDGEDTANEIRGLLGDLKNPKQAGKESYLVIVEVKEKEKKGQKVYTVGSIEVETSDYYFKNNSDTPIY